MQAERCNVELGIFALSQSSKTMWELYRSPGKRAKPLRLMNLTSQKEMKTFWNYYFLISASGAHTCLHFKGRRIYIGYSWSWFFFILMPFVEDLSGPAEVSDERKADLFLFMLLCRLLGSWHWLRCNFNACAPWGNGLRPAKAALASVHQDGPDTLGPPWHPPWATQLRAHLRAGGTMCAACCQGCNALYRLGQCQLQVAW